MSLQSREINLLNLSLFNRNSSFHLLKLTFQKYFIGINMQRSIIKIEVRLSDRRSLSFLKINVGSSSIKLPLHTLRELPRRNVV